MIYTIEKADRPDLEAVYAEAMDSLDAFFKINWERNRPEVLLVRDRKTIDALKGQESATWVVGWTDTGSVYLLDDRYFEQESDHKYSAQTYAELLKHELAHLFTSVVTGGAVKPIWLREGVAIYLSGQYAHRKKPEGFKAFLGFFERGGEGVYAESGFAVQFLVERYGRDKFIELLKGSKEHATPESFVAFFRSVYGFDLVYENFEVL